MSTPICTDMFIGDWASERKNNMEIYLLIHSLGSNEVPIDWRPNGTIKVKIWILSLKVEFVLPDMAFFESHQILFF